TTPRSAPSLRVSPTRRLGSRTVRCPHTARRVEPVGRLPPARGRSLHSARRTRRADARVLRSLAHRAPAGMTNERTAIVTGGTRGIGLGIARALAREGWRLALCGRRSEDTLRGILDELRKAGADVVYR